MVEQPHSGEAHHHVVTVAAVNHRIITDGAAWLCDILDAATEGTFDVVEEGEERIRAERHILDAGEIRTLFLAGEGLGLTGEIPLPYTVGTDVLFILVDLAVDHIIAVRAA